ncbi:uncharacterized protein LOC120334494 isoform X2 [Styela clava]
MAYECPIVRFHPNAGSENMAFGSQQQDEPFQDPIYVNTVPGVIQMEENIETVAVAESKEVKSSGKRSNIGKTVGFLILMSLLFVCLICITIFLVQATTKLEDANEEIMILQNITSEQKKETISSKQLLDRIQSQAMNIQRLSLRDEMIAKGLADLNDKRVNSQKNLIGLIKNSGEQVAKNISFMQQTIVNSQINLTDLIKNSEELVLELAMNISSMQQTIETLELNVGIRLIGGSNPKEGRVEILHEGKWGTICHHAWDIKDANVTCKMLGYDEAKKAYTNSHFGKGSGKLWLDHVSCTGTEDNIGQCNHKGWGVLNPGSDHCIPHHEDAGVACL